MRIEDWLIQSFNLNLLNPAQITPYYITGNPLKTPLLAYLPCSTPTQTSCAQAPSRRCMYGYMFICTLAATILLLVFMTLCVGYVGVIYSGIVRSQYTIPSRMGYQQQMDIEY